MEKNLFPTFGVWMAFQSGFEKKDECPIRWVVFYFHFAVFLVSYVQLPFKKKQKAFGG
jgi:hypothetical protein